MCVARWKRKEECRDWSWPPKDSQGVATEKGTVRKGSYSREQEEKRRVLKVVSMTKTLTKKQDGYDFNVNFSNGSFW